LKSFCPLHRTSSFPRFILALPQNSRNLMLPPLFGNRTHRAHHEGETEASTDGHNRQKNLCIRDMSPRPIWPFGVLFLESNRRPNTMKLKGAIARIHHAPHELGILMVSQSASSSGHDSTFVLVIGQHHSSSLKISSTRSASDHSFTITAHGAISLISLSTAN
jgi:hypothetical protein